jgi:hypothetical protein
MNNIMHSRVQSFIDYARTYVPKFKIAFKDQSFFMKLLGRILFFNKDFMTRFITTIGYTVYLPSTAYFEEDPDIYLNILTHEFVHMMDFKKFNLLFTLSYLLPQLLALPTILLSLFAIHHSHYWLFSILGILFTAPLPAFFRSHWELRGYTMDAAFEYWSSGDLQSATIYLDRFLGSGYYFMWPFKKNMKNRFQKMLDKVKNNSILNDEPYKIVHSWVVIK